jgi:hypothetical protein
MQLGRIKDSKDHSAWGIASDVLLDSESDVKSVSFLSLQNTTREPSFDISQFLKGSFVLSDHFTMRLSLSEGNFRPLNRLNAFSIRVRLFSVGFDKTSVEKLE